MNRRTYLGSVAAWTAAGLAGCLTRIGNSDDVNGPSIDAREYMLSADAITTDWLYAPAEDEEGYDFGVVNPNAVLAMDHRFADIRADLQLAGSRHLTFWQSIDESEITQLTFVDRDEHDDGYEAGAVVAEGEIDPDAVVAEAPDFFADQELVDEREYGGAELLEFGTGDLIAVGDAFVIFSIEPFRRGRDRSALVERVIDAHRGEHDRLLDENEDIVEALSWYDEMHVLEAGNGPRLAEAPDGALATAESLAIEGGFAHLRQVAVFENDADAEHASQFEISYEELEEDALIADTQVRGRTTIVEQRVDTEVITSSEDDEGGTGPGSGSGPGVPGM